MTKNKPIKKITYIAILRNDCTCCPCCGCFCEQDGSDYYESQDFGINELDAIKWIVKKIKNTKPFELIGYVRKIGPMGGNLGQMNIVTGKERDNYRK